MSFQGRTESPGDLSQGSAPTGRVAPSAPFAGFPPRTQAVALPSLFFSDLLPQIHDAAELRVCLHVFWRLGQLRGYPRFITYGQLAADPALRRGLGAADLPAALKAAVSRGVLLTLAVEHDGAGHQLYLINDQSSRRAVDRIARGELAVSLGSGPPAPAAVAAPEPRGVGASIFSLYEQNIGLLTPLIVEELAEAERKYPAAWIEEAFREAVQLKVRKWRYIARILERWATEGKEDGETRRHPETGGASRPRRPAGRGRHPLWG
ncbi:MAG: DnaD domain protein [Chloroflexi bacterium]|nr:DnaD domain protein [Chloroflexota bacterium]